MRDNDAILALLDDIKAILWGIALLILGFFLCLLGSLLGGVAGILLFLGIAVGVAGYFYAHRGFNRHEVVEKPDGKDDAHGL